MFDNCHNSNFGNTRYKIKKIVAYGYDLFPFTFPFIAFTLIFFFTSRKKVSAQMLLTSSRIHTAKLKTNHMFENCILKFIFF